MPQKKQFSVKATLTIRIKKDSNIRILLAIPDVAVLLNIIKARILLRWNSDYLPA